MHAVLVCNSRMPSHRVCFNTHAESSFLACSAPPTQKLDAFQIVKFPLTTESAMKKIEDNNTLVRSLFHAAMLITRLESQPSSGTE